MPADRSRQERLTWPPMQPELCIALSGLRAAVDRALGLPFGDPRDLPVQTTARLRSLLPEVSEAPGGRLEYRLPLVAPMKAGKSTLLNAVLCQELLPARGPAMTVLPTRVVPVRHDALSDPVLTLEGDIMLALTGLAARLAMPAQREAIAEQVRQFPALADTARRAARWSAPAGPLQITGRKAIRRCLSEVNDLLRLALSTLPGDDVLQQVLRLRAPEVIVSVPWLEADPAGGRLVLVDTPGPDEELRPGVLNGLVTAQVRSAHELLVVADATKGESSAEGSVRRLIDEAEPWPGQTSLIVAVNRADLTRELKVKLGRGITAGVASDAPELRAVWRRLAEGRPDSDIQLALTAARHGLAAASILWPGPSRGDFPRATREFLETTRPDDWEELLPKAADRRWLRERASVAWEWSGVPLLIDAFIGPRAREPGRMAVCVLLDRLASAIGPALEAVADDRTARSDPVASLVVRLDRVSKLTGSQKASMPELAIADGTLGLPDEFGGLIQPGQLLRICHRVDPGDLPVLHHQAHHDRPAVELDQARGGAIEPHGRRLDHGHHLVRPGEQLRHPLGPVDWGLRRGHDSAAIGDQDHVRCDELHQLQQLPGSQRGQEPLHHGLLLRPAHPHPRPPGGHVRASPPSDLPHRNLRFPHSLSDLRVGHLENLAEDKHRSLRRPERLKHRQHRNRHALRQLDVLGDIGAGQQRLRQPLPHILLTAPRQRPQPVQRLPRHHPDQVRPRVVHLRVVDICPPQPRLLEHVFCVGRRPEHLVGDGEQQAAMGDERVLGHTVDATPEFAGRGASGTSHAEEKP
jgi:hypothetical protein